MTGVASPRRGDPALLIRDESVTLGDDAPRSFDVTNRDADAVRITALDVEPADGRSDGTPGYEAVVDAGQSVHSSIGGGTLRFDDPVVVDPGETATVYLHGVAGGEAVVTLHSERDGRRHETTVHLSD